ncbi:Hypothetical predicted protein [Cloeon dipterum]|uniref:Uncharacterized protein n=1 Tax=Cloeon dipterum TaxID=197152 RepID=A0A8S1E9Z9_9INSE|nr:Hypothetical predicted protein [Cloeon dipterum]
MLDSGPLREAVLPVADVPSEVGVPGRPAAGTLVCGGRGELRAELEEYYCSQWKLQEAAQRAENWAQASRVSNKPGFADAWALRDERT